MVVSTLFFSFKVGKFKVCGYYARVVRIFLKDFFFPKWRPKSKMATVSMKKLSFCERPTELSHMVTTMINSSMNR